LITQPALYVTKRDLRTLYILILSPNWKNVISLSASRQMQEVFFCYPNLADWSWCPSSFPLTGYRAQSCRWVKVITHV